LDFVECYLYFIIFISFTEKAWISFHVKCFFFCLSDNLKDVVLSLLTVSVMVAYNLCGVLKSLPCVEDFLLLFSNHPFRSDSNKEFFPDCIPEPFNHYRIHLLLTKPEEFWVYFMFVLSRSPQIKHFKSFVFFFYLFEPFWKCFKCSILPMCSLLLVCSCVNSSITVASTRLGRSCWFC
jgi:hypothetical protein